MKTFHLRVRDRFIIRTVIAREYRKKTASSLPDRVVLSSLMEAFWEPREASTDKQAFLGITKAVGKLVDLFKHAPKLWDKLQEALDLPDLSSASLLEKAKVIGSALKDAAEDGKKLLKDVLHDMAHTFPLSVFFAPKSKVPTITDLLMKIVEKSPRMKALLNKVHEGASYIDHLFKEYIPTLSRAAYAAIFIWVWLNAAEISWDIESILKGFFGMISLSELLASLPESGIGFIASAFGLGFGALPYAIAFRIIWLVANHYLEWKPGHGIVVKWEHMGVEERDEHISL